jgi:hypothetical protein
LSEFLTVNRIEFVVTYRCNSRCKHCQVSLDHRRQRPAAIRPELAAQIVHQVAEVYASRSVMTFGGEPLLFPDVVCAVHSTARDSGIPKRQIITNAGWPRSKEASRAMAGRLAASGVNEIYVSVDGFHQEYIPLSVVEQNVRAYLEAGVSLLRWNPCWVLSKEHDNEWNRRTHRVLQSLSQFPVAESDGNIVQPMGNAITWLSKYLPLPVSAPLGGCGDAPYTGRLDQVESISIEPGGSITVCDEFAIGNAADDVVSLLRNYDPYQIPEMKALLENGIAGLVELARARGVEPDPAGYYSVCDMCKSIRRKLQVGKHGLC